MSLNSVRISLGHSLVRTEGTSFYKNVTDKALRETNLVKAVMGGGEGGGIYLSVIYTESLIWLLPFIIISNCLQIGALEKSISFTN